MYLINCAQLNRLEQVSLTKPVWSNGLDQIDLSKYGFLPGICVKNHAPNSKGIG